MCIIEVITNYFVYYAKNNNYQIVALEQTDKSISLSEFKINKDNKYALIFGNEVKGVDQEIIDLCDFSVEIPQFGTKHSFNICVSAGITLWDLACKFNQE